MAKSKRWLSALGAMGLAAGAVFAPSYADDRDDLVNKKKQQEAQIESYKSSLEGVDTNLQAVYLKLKETQAQIPVAQAELATAQSELAAATRQQEAVSAQLQAAQGELKTIKQTVSANQENVESTRKDVGAVARARYRGESVPTRWDMLVGSKTSKEFLDAISASRTAERTQSTALLKAEQATASAKNRQARQSAVEAKIGQLKKEADNLVSAKTQKESAAQAKANNLASLQSSYSTQSQQLSAQKQSFQASLANVNSARDQTAAQIAQIDAENQRKAQAARAAPPGGAPKNAGGGPHAGGANTGGEGGGSGSGGSGGGGGGASGGGFLIPVIPRPLYVTSPFGMREYPFGGRWMHNGVDLRSPCGQAQVAPGNGVVASVRPAAGNSTHGNQVFINLGNVNGHSWVAVTNHMSAFNVRPGQSVTQGQVIGWTGQTGQVTGCHVHMEVWRDGQVINPMSLPGF